MAARVVAAVEERLVVVLATAEAGKWRSERREKMRCAWWS
jgi:hypothetical protein